IATRFMGASSDRRHGSPQSDRERYLAVTSRANRLDSVPSFGPLMEIGSLRGAWDMTTKWKTWPIGVLLISLPALAGDVPTSSGDLEPKKGAPIPARIEILPGEREKWFDPVLAEPIAVAVLGGAGVDVHEIDAATLVLAGAAVSKDDEGSLAS